MSISEIIQDLTKWLAWGGAGASLLTILAYLFSWGIKFRLTGITIFTLLLSASCWAFDQSYTPPFKFPAICSNVGLMASSGKSFDACATTKSNPLS